MNKTFITWNDHEPINEGATFTSDAENILAKDIAFMVRKYYYILYIRF